jgi:hypothetical protein
VIPGFGLDRSLRALTAGTRVGEIVVRDEESAGQIFALRMARRVYGSRAGVRGFKDDGIAGGNGQIFVAWLEDASGKHGQEVRFAVIEH